MKVCEYFYAFLSKCLSVELFNQYEEESYADIQKLLEQVKDMPKEIFTFLLDKIYKRSK